MTTDAETRASRIALLLVFEIQRIVRHLRIRRTMLVKTWSRFRAREPFLETMFSRWRTLDLRDLALLPEHVHQPLEMFFEELDDFRYYVSFTDDMPTTLEDQYDVSLARLTDAAENAVHALGYAFDGSEASTGEVVLLTERLASQEPAD
jgi:hypothetical protein